jgi:cytidylate kinase
MENLLYEYMSQRFLSGRDLTRIPRDSGPVITISRQAGCGATRLAHELCKKFNTDTPATSLQVPWQFVNHEILEKSAEKLNLEPGKLDRVITDKERGIMDQIVEALSTHSHKSDHKIMKTMQEVIRQIAEQGRVIIVGRGGAVVSQHIPRALHLRLEAPLEWRVEQIIKKLEYSRDYARDYILKLDEQREMYVKKMAGGSENHYLYHAVINPSRYTEAELMNLIMHMAKLNDIH